MKKALEFLKELVTLFSEFATYLCFAFFIYWWHNEEYAKAINSVISSIVFILWDIKREIERKK